MSEYYTSDNFKILQKHINLFNLNLNNKKYNYISCTKLDCGDCPFFIAGEQCAVVNEYKLTNEQTNILADSNPELFI